MHNTKSRARAATWLVAFTALSAAMVPVALAADEDPPGRVARVNLLDGRGAVEPAGTGDWVDDLLNRPLIGGDKVWIDAGSRAEMHIGSTALRLGARTALQIIAVDDRQVRLRVTAGSVSVRVRALYDDDRFEIETPAGDISLLQPGGYRLDVDDRDARAQFAVWSGRAEVRGDSGGRVLRSDEAVDLIGGDEPALETAAAGTPDSLDLWAEDRDHREDESRAARYVSRDVVGYEELDGYGDWVVDPSYGSVWMPQVVAIDWAPYRFGHWVWIGVWGWTWIDDAPWGFAPCHYGRWVHLDRGWAWAPGPRDWHRPVFAPALVAWRGDRYPRRDAGNERAPHVGWVPLGYNEVYEPPFRASRNYLRAANLSNTRLGRVDVDRYLGDARTGAGEARPGRHYVNENVPGAMTTVSRATFVGARSVARNRINAGPDDARQAPFSARGPDLRPEPRSVGRILPSDRPVIRPDRSVFDRPVKAAPGPAAPPANGQPAGREGGERARPLAPITQRIPAAPAAVRAPPSAPPPAERRFERIERAPPPSAPPADSRRESPPRVESLPRFESTPRSEPPQRYSPPPEYHAPPRPAPPRPAPERESHYTPPPSAPSVSAPPSGSPARADRRPDRGQR
ncbi:MAG: FecR domain-containing protein [Gammaproteobacteria bacterium]|nr:FecR domain-containing protein [Gammaproteobacteria bacterium]